MRKQPFPSEELIDSTLAFWQPQYPDRKLTRQDAVEIIENVVGYFDLLMEWDAEERLLENKKAA